MWSLRKKTAPEPERPIPHCRDCRWVLPSEDGGLKFAKCGHVAAGYNDDRLDLVTGNPKDRKQFYASVARGSAGVCRPEGRLFEPMYLDLQPVHSEICPVPKLLEMVRRR
jgi:hypothetical protein